MKTYLLKLLLSAIAIVFYYNYSIAEEKSEILHLKGGMAVAGKIIENGDNDIVKIKTDNGTTLSYKRSDIDSITQGEIIIHSTSKKKPNNPLVRKGYRGFVDIGGVLLFNNPHWDNNGLISISTSHGYQFNQYLYIGAGAAVDFYPTDGSSILIFGDIRTYFIDKVSTPFIDVKIGFDPRFDIMNQNYYKYTDKAIFYFNPSIGYSFGINRNFAINLSVGLSFYREKGYSLLGEKPTNKKTKGISIKLGFEF